MKRRLIAGVAGVVAVGGGVAIAFSSLAQATGGTIIPLQQLENWGPKSQPITAAGFASTNGTGSCPGVPSYEDGWHFVLPGAKSSGQTFTSITLDFSSGKELGITYVQGKTQAYVATTAGAALIGPTGGLAPPAVTYATVTTPTGQKQVVHFTLSHTCPATTQPTSTPSPSTTPSVTPSTTPPVTPTPTPSVTPSTTPPVTPTPTPSTTPPAPTPTPVPSTLPVTG